MSSAREHNRALRVSEDNLPSAYAAALRLLSRRDFTSAQLSSRLRRQKYSEDEIAETLAKLLEGRALDDRRVAAQYVRTEAGVKLRGRHRILSGLQAMGLDRREANDVMNQVLAELDEAALLERALSRRLKGAITSEAQLRRLYGYLVRQGFSTEAIVGVLKAHQKPSRD